MSRNRRFCLAAVLLVLARAVCHSSSDDSDESYAASSDSISSESAGDLDSRLIGGWRHTDAYASGEFTAAVDDYLWLYANGSFREGGNAAAGDAGTSMVTGEGDRGDGEWKCEGKVLYLRPTGGDWIDVAGYSVDDSHLLLRYGNGSKKIWERM